MGKQNLQNGVWLVAAVLTGVGAAGGPMAGAFVAERTWDRAVSFVAPLLIGGERAPGPIGGEGVADLAAADRLEGLRARRIGSDLLLTGMREGCLRDLSASVGA